MRTQTAEELYADYLTTELLAARWLYDNQESPRRPRLLGLQDGSFVLQWAEPGGHPLFRGLVLSQQLTLPTFGSVGHATAILATPALALRDYAALCSTGRVTLTGWDVLTGKHVEVTVPAVKAAP